MSEGEGHPYTYVQSEESLWTVGTGSRAEGTWQPERDLGDPEEAAGRVAWLNGGRRTGPLGEGERQRLRAYILGLNHTAGQADEAVKEIARILGRSA